MNLRFYFALGGLKTLDRTGWVKREIPNPEKVDQHMYRSQYIAYDIAKELGGSPVFCMSCAFMMMVHDMPEMPFLGVGDITPTCHVADKAELELNAATQASVMSGNPEFLEIFKEFEAKETLRSRICTDADSLECIVQALEYEQLYPEKKTDFDSFWPYAEAKITTEPGKRLFRELQMLRLEIGKPLAPVAAPIVAQTFTP